MMPDTRGRTSATRVGAMRPGNSRTIGRGVGVAEMMVTSGASGALEATALLSSQPASQGSIPTVNPTANSRAHTGRMIGPD